MIREVDVPVAPCGIYLLRGFARENSKLKVMYYIGESANLVGRLIAHRGEAARPQTKDGTEWFVDAPRMMLIREITEEEDSRTLKATRLYHETRFIEAAWSMSLPLLNKTHGRGRGVMINLESEIEVIKESLRLFKSKKVCRWLSVAEVALLNQKKAV